LAKELNCPVLSADSRQFYREMTIGTAKPLPHEMDGVPHYFVGHLSIGDSYTAGQFEQDALKVLEKVFAESDYAILVGGSGLYIDAVCKGIDDLPRNSEIRDTLTEEWKTEGLVPLQARLAELDPDYWASCDQQNPHRVIRALEIIGAGGKKVSEWHTHTPQQRSFVIRHFVLDLPRELLYTRINTRVDHMMAAGLLDEVRALWDHRDKQAMKTVGYSELVDYLNGKFTLDEAVHYIKQNSRRYAKRQVTWFKRESSTQFIQATELEDQVNQIRHHLNEKSPHEAG
jgi:tRNA dimethylallyltransferase